MEVSKSVRAYQAQRVFLSSPRPWKDVTEALSEELNMRKTGPGLLQRVLSAKNKDDIEHAIAEATEGTRDFV